MKIALVIGNKLIETDFKSPKYGEYGTDGKSLYIYVRKKWQKVNINIKKSNLKIYYIKPIK